MANPNEETKSYDLEILSVGALYSGSWDKKYWSSSRGKDRFPHPVGYRAVRVLYGNSYYMEIEEGAKGPLFLIRYLAESWTGPTPDIAWGKFQKTGFSHLKIWHGKRFSCKMKGMELHLSLFLLALWTIWHVTIITKFKVDQYQTSVTAFQYIACLS